MSIGGSALPLSISNPSSFGSTTIGGAVSAALVAVGGAPPYTFALQSGTLPPGVMLQGPGETLAASFNPGFSYLTGRPMQLGTFAFALSVTDAASVTATKTFSWNVSPLASSYASLPLPGTGRSSLASFARSLLGATPMEQPSPVAARMEFCMRRASDAPPCSVPPATAPKSM